MRKTSLSLIAISTVSLLTGCVSVGSGGDTSLNAEAMRIQNQKNFHRDIERHDRELQACLIYSHVVQNSVVGKSHMTASQQACRDQEINYRATVMSGVRKEWRSDPRILGNTANTATKKLYTSVKGLIER